MCSKQDGFELYLVYRNLRIQIVLTGLILILLSDLEFMNELYLERQIPKKTERVVSGLILT